MKRWYVDDILGDGTIDNPFRPSLADQIDPSKEGFTAVMPPTPGGVPAQRWCLVLVEAPNHTRFPGVSAASKLPDFPLDGEYNAIDRDARDAATSALTRRGVAPPAMNPGEGYRFYVRRLGRLIQSGFHEESMDVKAGQQG
jgi:hypothetical protein